MATTGADGAARIWDPVTGEQLHSVEQPDGGEAWGPSFSPDGASFAAAWPDDHGGVVRILDLESGRVHEIDGVPRPIATSFDPGGPRLAVASNQEPIAVVVDVHTGDRAVHRHRTFRTLTGRRLESRRLDHRDGGRGRQRPLVRRRDRATAVRPPRSRGGGRRGRMEPRLQANDHRQCRRHGQGLVPDRGRRPGALQPVGPRPGGRDPRCRVLTRRQPGHDRRRRHHHHDHLERRRHWAGAEVANLPAVALHARRRWPSVPTVATSSRTAVAVAIRVWDPETWSTVRTFGMRGTPTPSAIPGVPLGSSGDIADSTLAVDPSGRLVAAHAREPAVAVEVWDLETGRRAFTVPGDPGVSGPAWSPDGQLLAVLRRGGP